MQKVIAGLLSLLLLSGCSSVYRDAAVRNKSCRSPAILMNDKPTTSHIVIWKIDGRQHGISLFKKYELTPGDHSLLISPGLPYDGDKLTVQFKAKEGEVYHVDAKLNAEAKRWTVWVIEDSTGKRFQPELAEP